MAKAKDAFRTISEVAEWLDTPTHVLRFWESKFTQIRPVKGAGGRRYYRPADMDLLGGIKQLLHEDGLTIKGVQKILRDHGVRHVASLGPNITNAAPAPSQDPAPLAIPTYRLIGRAPLDAADLAADAAAITPLLARLAALRARMQPDLR
jgi:DNA-binding transcriptional MerR regulator